MVDFPVPGGPWTRTIWVDWGLVVQIRDVVRATRLCSVFSPMIMGTPEVKIAESYWRGSGEAILSNVVQGCFLAIISATRD